MTSKKGFNLQKMENRDFIRSSGIPEINFWGNEKKKTVSQLHWSISPWIKEKAQAERFSLAIRTNKILGIFCMVPRKNCVRFFYSRKRSKDQILITEIIKLERYSWRISDYCCHQMNGASNWTTIIFETTTTCKTNSSSNNITS